jgi:hypothetical protein
MIINSGYLFFQGTKRTIMSGFVQLPLSTYYRSGNYCWMAKLASKGPAMDLGYYPS